MAPCRVIDITGQCSGPKGGDYVLQTQDIESHEKEFGILEKGTIVLVRTGWSRFYPDGPASYLGFDETVQGPYNPHTSRLRFPGIGIEAAKLLVKRQVAGVGLDGASLDPGSSANFMVHRILLQAGIYGIENINANINDVPISGSSLVVMPTKITGGSGAPARVVCVTTGRLDK
eukprot:TRINITY_DN9443_c0_g1_i2.p1 TRINITY_DN9443_c0_g1~~TRINITY_DN9443_c0_g1_i2.p1  ORF type:complete len:174 (-),score=33.13 TRINITY_DN9443_c0_g1_i2:273-794(-)